MDAYGAGLLGQTGYRLLDFPSGSHKQVGELVDYNHYVRHVCMTLERVQLAAQELLVILCNLPLTCNAQQLVAVVHLDAERFQRTDYFVGVGNYGFILVGQLGQIVLLQQTVEVELNLLGVYHHKLQLAGMLGEEQ